MPCEPAVPHSCRCIDYEYRIILDISRFNHTYLVPTAYTSRLRYLHAQDSPPVSGTPYRTRFAPAELLQLISGDFRVIYSKAPDLAWRHDTDTDKGRLLPDVTIPGNSLKKLSVPS